MTIAPVNPATYGALTGTTFRIATPPFAISADLTLQSVDHRKASGSDSHSLSLLFHGPHQPFIPQGIYFVLHDQLPPQPLFIVPVGPYEGGFRYEIIFSYYEPDPAAISTRGEA